MDLFTAIVVSCLFELGNMLEGLITAERETLSNFFMVGFAVTDT